MLKLLIGAALLVLTAVGVLSRHAVPAVPQTSPTSVLPTPAAGQEAVAITEAQLNDAISERMVGQPFGDTPAGPATLQRVQTHLANGVIQADGDARVGSSTVPVSMTSRVDVQNGRPVVVVQDARAAGVPVPNATRTSIQQVLQRELDQQVQGLGLRVVSLTIADGRLIVLGTR